MILYFIVQYMATYFEILGLFFRLKDLWFQISVSHGHNLIEMFVSFLKSFLIKNHLHFLQNQSFDLYFFTLVIFSQLPWYHSQHLTHLIISSSSLVLLNSIRHEQYISIALSVALKSFFFICTTRWKYRYFPSLQTWNQMLP